MIGLKVPGSGNWNSRVMIIGEGPGIQESIHQIPFCGASGSELDYVYLRRAAGIEREDVFVSNIVKYRTDESDSDPTQADIDRDIDELLTEISLVDPEIIVAVGKVSANWFMMQSDVDLEKYYGIPIQCPRFPDKILVITHHPAAALRLPERYMHLIFWSFQQVGRLLRGEIGVMKPMYTPEITLLNSAYIADSPIAFDTEGSLPDPWGMSFSTHPSLGYVVRGKGNIEFGAEVQLEAHNVLYDVNIIEGLGQGIDLTLCDDTMLMAYLLPWLPRALKPLMYKLCGMEQATYEETIGPAEEKVTRSYFDAVLKSGACTGCNGTGKVNEPYKRRNNCTYCKGTKSITEHQDDCQAGETAEGTILCKIYCKRTMCGVCGGTGKSDKPTKFKLVQCPDCTGDGTTWPKPAPQLLFDRDPGGRIYQPRSVGRTVRAALERGANLRPIWDAVDVEVRNVIESKLGRLREATLDDIPLEKAVRYSGMDACGTRAVSIELKRLLRENNLESVYQMDKAILPIIHQMHRNGILIDRPYFEELGKDFAGQQTQISDKLSTIVTGSFNPASPLQVAALLYDQLGLKAPRHSRSTDDKTMETLKLKYASNSQAVEVMDLIGEYREIAKLQGTYVEPLLEIADANDRVHTQFLLHVTTSGRLSSRNVNLQNVPTRSERGKLIRKGFIARPGCSLVSVDLDQIELRVTAHLSEDENMIEVFRSGKDIHRSTAALIYGKPEDQITAQERLLSKTMNFLILYGGGPGKLRKELSLMGITTSEDECVGYINDWFKAYPNVRQFMDRCYAQAKALGYIEDLFGRRRYLPGIYSTIDKIKEETRRWATNHPSQGTAAGLLKLWMADVDRNVLPKMDCYCVPLLTVHDELVFETEKGSEQKLIDLTVQSAANLVDFLVPIGAKGNYGHSWSELK